MINILRKSLLLTLQNPHLINKKGRRYDLILWVLQKLCNILSYTTLEYQCNSITSYEILETKWKRKSYYTIQIIAIRSECVNLSRFAFYGVCLEIYLLHPRMGAWVGFAVWVVVVSMGLYSLFSTDLNNGLAPNIWQAAISTNCGHLGGLTTLCELHKHIFVRR